MSNSKVNELEVFETQLAKRHAEIQAILPQHVPAKRFVNTAIIAIKNRPELLFVDRRSLHKAITQAAEDGLMPDGREGTINIYREKRGDEWVDVACWIPMVHGIRKRAMELAGLILNAEVVHKNDTFVWHKGDEPKIEHVPAQLGEPRGDMIGAYCIIKRGDEILHREVMDAGQIAKVKKLVKAKNGLLWTDFEDEAWRKTVVKRGIKTVPSIPDALRTMVDRDNEHYDLDLKANAPAAVGNLLLAPPPPPPPGSRSAGAPPAASPAATTGPDPATDGRFEGTAGVSGAAGNSYSDPYSDTEAA